MTTKKPPQRSTAKNPPRRKVHPPDFPGEYRVGSDGKYQTPVVFRGTNGGIRIIRKPETLA